MNTRLTLAAALAAALLALAPVQAQAPTPADTQKMEAKIAALQTQVNALQAQVKQLQQSLIRARSLAGLPSAGVSPFYRLPNSSFPDLILPGMTFPGTPSVTIVPPAPYYSNIPECRITLLKQASR